MSDWILIGVLVAPLYLKLYQLRAIHIERGLLHLEFGKVPSESSRPIRRDKRKVTNA
jgi:hypothetical protein